MDRTIVYKITEQSEGMTVRQLLKQCGYSHRILAHLKHKEMGICVDGDAVYMNHPLHKGELLTVHFTEGASSVHVIPVPLPLEIVYEDEDLLVVNKPAGMPVHPSLNNYGNSLANAAAYYFSEQGLPFVFRCVNRLDRDTSGLTVLAKNMLSAAILSDMVKRKVMKREYLAVAEGITEQSGTIDAPLSRKEGSIIERTVDFENGETAVTHYERLSVVTISGESGSRNYSFLKILLETGRTHQIRVHLRHIGHPLPGDFLYNPDYSIIKRQALHSACLSFPHPITGKTLHFELPLPEDMRQILSNSVPFP